MTDSQRSRMSTLPATATTFRPMLQQMKLMIMCMPVLQVTGRQTHTA